MLEWKSSLEEQYTYAHTHGWNEETTRKQREETERHDRLIVTWAQEAETRSMLHSLRSGTLTIYAIKMHNAFDCQSISSERI
jgi:hypothetical protein